MHLLEDVHCKWPRISTGTKSLETVASGTFYFNKYALARLKRVMVTTWFRLQSAVEAY